MPENGAKLKKDAEALLKQLAEGEIGIQYTDGTWDTAFPAPGAGAQLAASGTRKNLAFDPALPFHKQHGHVPTTADDTKAGHDDRDARSSEYS